MSRSTQLNTEFIDQEDQEASDALDSLAHMQAPLDTIQEGYDEEEVVVVTSFTLLYITGLIIALYIVISVIPIDSFILQMLPAYVKHLFFSNIIVRGLILAICVFIILKTQL